MRPQDVIKKKRDGLPLTETEIRDFLTDYLAGDIPDYQVSALCMAIYFRGMTPKETTALTLAIRDSGDILHLEGLSGPRVDKHSTGGVGDKTSLIVAPVVASLGVKVAKISGRGLGHTGGTVDKLESISGFRTELTTAELETVVREVGVAIVGQSQGLAPADKLLYALRDVTATVDSLPLIASSIMGKKLAANDDGILLDVKIGSGAFLPSRGDGLALAQAMVDIGKAAGKRVRALITDMDKPLGHAIGNSLEVVEAIRTLRGEGPRDLTELCVLLATHMLVLADRGREEECEQMARAALTDGSALRTFEAMVKAQGGDPHWIRHPESFPLAPYRHQVLAPADGYITSVDCAGYGTAALLLGAGRTRKEDSIDPLAGILLHARTGDAVRAGQPLATLHTSHASLLEAAEETLLSATTIGKVMPSASPLLLGIVE